MAKKSFLSLISLILVIIGGLNWGLYGLFDFNLVDFVLGSIPVAVKIVYVLIGLSALYMLKYLKK